MDQLSLAPWERESIDWGAEPIRVVSWNVNGIRAVEKKGFHDILDKLKPTIFCAQETKAHREQCGLTLQDNEKWVSYWSSAKRPGYSGVATFCREKPLDVQYGMGVEKFDNEGRIVLTKHPHFTVLNMYYPNGGSGAERQAFKMEFLDDALQFFKKLQSEGHKLVICGDYNIAHREIDIYDPIGNAEESGFLPEERKWMDKLLAAGFVDTFRHFYPNEKAAYTWWSYFSGARVANKGWRIDYICVSQSLVGNLKSATILPEVTGSDHCPVVAEFEF